MSNFLKHIAYCGLYCGLCSARNRISKQASDLHKTMKNEGYEFWATEVPNFNEFWKFLSSSCNPDNCCPGCRDGGGPPFCGIRKCAQNRDIEICVDCDEFPCHRIEGLAEGYPTVISDSRRMKKIGIEKWVEEQKKRAETGFCYSDIRCYPYSVPED